MNKLTVQMERIIGNATPEDTQILSDFLTNLEKKQQGEFTTYLTAGLNMSREITADSCKVTIPNTSFIHNSISIPHGGILAVLLDTAMGVLANSKCRPGYGAVTTNLSIHYLAVTNDETISAEARIVRNGKHTIVAEGNIFQKDGKHIATSTASFFIIPETM